MPVVDSKGKCESSENSATKGGCTTAQRSSRDDLQLRAWIDFTERLGFLSLGLVQVKRFFRSLAEDDVCVPWDLYATILHFDSLCKTYS